jgi:hypothetical protein
MWSIIAAIFAVILGVAMTPRYGWRPIIAWFVSTFFYVVFFIACWWWERAAMMDAGVGSAEKLPQIPMEPGLPFFIALVGGVGIILVIVLAEPSAKLRAREEELRAPLIKARSAGAYKESATYWERSFKEQKDRADNMERRGDQALELVVKMTTKLDELGWKIKDDKIIPKEGINVPPPTP